MARKNTNNIVAAILVLTLVLTIAAAGLNLQSISAPAQEGPSGSTGKVQLYVEEKAEPSNAAGMVTLVVK